MASKLSYMLRQLGLLATPITAPAVSFWESRVQVTLSADFSDDHVNKLVDCIIKASRNAGIAKKLKAQRRMYSYADNDYDVEDEIFEEHVGCFRNILRLIKLDIPNQGIYHSASKRAFERNYGPSVLQAGHAPRARYRLGSSGSRWVAGTFAPHLEVEQMLAKATQQEAAMTFANAEFGLSSTIAALCRPLLGYKNHYMLVSASAHESVLEGLRMASRKEKPETSTYKNFEELFKVMSRLTSKKTYFTICFDTVIEGKLADIKKIVPRLHKCKGQSGMTLLLNDSAGLGQHGPDRLGIAGSTDLWSTAQVLDARILCVWVILPGI
jgi:serine palmitoyltransferase